MIQYEQGFGHQRPLVAKALLVLALLVGLVGMHGMVSAPPASASASATGAHHADPAPDPEPGHHAMAPAATMTGGVADRGERACHGQGKDGGQHSAAHADDLCAAAGVSGSPTLPALAPSPHPSQSPASEALQPAPYEPVGGRAPPTLAELQLLRI
ncbi:DUF6153 family protein [Streptomyces daliensis]